MESPPIDDCSFILTVHVSPYISNIHNSVSELSRVSILTVSSLSLVFFGNPIRSISCCRRVNSNSPDYRYDFVVGNEGDKNKQ